MIIKVSRIPSPSVISILPRINNHEVVPTAAPPARLAASSTPSLSTSLSAWSTLAHPLAASCMASSNASLSHEPVTTTWVASPNVAMWAMVTPPSDITSSAAVGSNNSVDADVEAGVAEDEEEGDTRVTEQAETKSRMATPACARAADAAATAAGSSAPPASNTCE